MLTFSRSAIAIFLIGGIVFFGTLIFSKALIIEKIKLLKIFIVTILIFISLGFAFGSEIVFRTSSILSDQSLSQRFFYNEIALNQIASSPILGVGIGNFIIDFHARYSGVAVWQYQPAHNLFLLIASEIGILGALLLIIFIVQNLYRLIRNKFNSGDIFTISILIVFLDYLILANFDHYFWTIQQGQILFWLVVGMLNQREN
jgi:O-antigen ligase